MTTLRYVLITPARNEGAFIGKALESVIHQTVLPIKWVIVNDGSTDDTGTIVEKYLSQHSWIELVTMAPRRDRSFAAKVYCFNAGLERLQSLDYDVIANLDADVSFDKDHFEFLMDKLASFPEVGVTSTGYTEHGHVAKYSFKDVAGQCQVFRRKCFEDIGGYFPSKYGGVDWIAVRMARMKGWKTITFTERTFCHHRLMGTAESGPLHTRVHYGKKDYFLGNHPLWELCRVAYQMTHKPYLIGGLLLAYGYMYAVVTRMERPVSKELVKFNQQEQLERIRLTLKGLLKLKMNAFET